MGAGGSRDVCLACPDSLAGSVSGLALGCGNVVAQSTIRRNESKKSDFIVVCALLTTERQLDKKRTGAFSWWMATQKSPE